MQTAVIEFARHVAGLTTANSTEFDKNTPYPVVGLITEWMDEDGQKRYRDENSDMGGTMRLGAQICQLHETTLALSIYHKEQIIERHRHRYEVNNKYIEALVEKGLVIAGHSVDKNLVEVIELADHPWFIGCQFHPEFTSTPRDGHPLFSSFVTAARENANAKEKS